VVIQAWDSMEALMKWFNRAEYQEALKIGQKFAIFCRCAIEGQ